MMTSTSLGVSHPLPADTQATDGLTGLPMSCQCVVAVAAVIWVSLHQLASHWMIVMHSLGIEKAAAPVAVGSLLGQHAPRVGVELHGQSHLACTLSKCLGPSQYPISILS